MTIDHAAEARKHIEAAHEQQEREGEYEWSIRDNALIAQAEATLALVEQQRIANEHVRVANLITYVEIPDGALTTAFKRNMHRDDIKKGLGLS